MTDFQLFSSLYITKFSFFSGFEIQIFGFMQNIDTQSINFKITRNYTGGLQRYIPCSATQADKKTLSQKVISRT